MDWSRINGLLFPTFPRENIGMEVLDGNPQPFLGFAENSIGISYHF